MTNKKKNLLSFTLVILGIIALSLLTERFYFRLDLTTDKRYTLSPPSKQVLNLLDDVVYVKIYLDGEMPVGMKKFQKSIKETLDEFHRYAGDNLQYQFINPSAGNEKQRQAIYTELSKKGIQPLTIHEQDADGGATQRLLFPGASVLFKGKELTVNLVQNNPLYSADVNMNLGLQNLEYELINAIHLISRDQQDRIAFVEGHDELDDNQLGDAMDMLSAYYTVERVEIGSYYPDLFEYKVIVIAKPLAAWTESDKLGIDQYIMQGGRTAWFIDAVHVHADSLARGETSFGMINDHNLDDQLFNYGVRLNPNIVQDLQSGSVQVNVAVQGPPDFRLAPWTYYPLLYPTDTNTITKGLNMIRAQYVGSIDFVGHSDQVKKQVLLSTSAKSKVNQAPLRISLSQINESLEERNFNMPSQTVAAVLEGAFQSPFRNRAAAKQTPIPFIAQSKPTKMVIVADGDVIQNDISRRGDQVGIYPLGYDKYTKITYGNRDFIKNVISFLADDDQLMQIRNRTIQLRLLDKTKVVEYRNVVIIMNTLLPLLLLLIGGGLFIWWRKHQYT